MTAIARLLDDFARRRRPLRSLGASGQLGYGIPTPAFEAGLGRAPDMIGVDMGSIDIGPNYLGSGKLAPTRGGAKRDLRKVLNAARRLDIPLIVGSAGSAGARPHLDQTLAIIREIAAEDGLRFRMGVVAADVSPGVVKQALRAGRVRPMDTMPPLTEADVDATSNLVGQLGLEAFRRALEADVDVVALGRACDTGIFASIPAMLGFPPGIAMHMAKIVECASLCCSPGGRDTILGILDDDGFELESMAPSRAATPASVAAHSLYEQADPFEIREPAGRVDLRDVTYRALDSRRTRVEGARFEPASGLTLKLEGASFLGHRALLLAGVADPRFIARYEEIFAAVTTVVRNLVCEDSPEDYRLGFRLYGVDGVRAWAGAPGQMPREAFVLGECLAPTPERAEEVIRTTKQYLLHHGYEGRLSTAGNLAFPFTPPEVMVGPAYRFNVFHLMEVDDMASLFPVEVETFG
ncbi:acyclic terpene utilization AtuA family protein [Bradyrhizobium sp. LHD-71]|uniref:acyclic terpene utilization AtuA family protein n=1 Tax=Bradyrhizobium sp. LHD-71 TaxID=3072141 RepID=UPI00280D0568|nr:acyclic terpene utilization AtuA family protein [Bradyrhizobium sp. LHD-71]MDQ8728287.1 acyclic terpene utilization AtuA family protein [Bradyrhizobium sp. LHD-71]